MSLVIGLLAAAVLAAQLGTALDARRDKPARPSEPANGSPVRLAADVG